MGLLNDLESWKYSFVLDLLKHPEAHDKNKSTLSGEEVFKLCQERYQMMQDILLPLRKKLGEDIEIVDINFAQGMQEDTSIVVRYIKDDKKNYFTITNLGFDDIEILASDDKLERYGFVMATKKTILKIFNQVYADSLDSDFYLNSTSNKFIVRSTCNNFSIRDSSERIFSIEGMHALYKKDGLMYDPEKISSAYPKLKELLEKEENIMRIYQNLRIYEEDYPKILKKTNQ